MRLPYLTTPPERVLLLAAVVGFVGALIWQLSRERQRAESVASGPIIPAAAAPSP